MGVIAMRPMLNAGYDTRLAAGVITAGGTLGILIPPSVMIIVYAAVAGQSVVKLYAAAMFPGFFLSLLYLVYIIGWVLINPKIAPRVPDSQMVVPVRPWVAHIAASYNRRMLPALLAAVVSPGKALQGAAKDAGLTWARLVGNLAKALVPVLLTVATLGAVWWYVVIHSQQDADTSAKPVAAQAEKRAAASAPAAGGVQEPPGAGAVQEPPGASGVQEPPGAAGVQEPPGSDSLQEPPGSGGAQASSEPPQAEAPLQQLGDPSEVDAARQVAVPESFYIGFWITCAIALAVLAW